jgi:signal transduction histidine kinase
MKLSDYLNILKESRPWILLLCINDIFFIFLAWTAYPETFRLLVGIMIVFSIASIILGMLYAWKGKKNQDKVFYDFFRQPSWEHEHELIKTIGELHKEKVKVVSHMEDVPIVSDKKALQFIFTQIFVNAAKYSNEKIDSFIWLKTGFDSSNNRYYLRIWDNGMGVLNSDLPFIFDKGFTGDSLSQKQSTGIGLYLVKKLCDELQIGIEVESEYGKGFAI